MFLALSCGRDDGGDYLSHLHFKVESSAPKHGTQDIFYGYSEITSCHVIAANQDMEEDTVEMAFRRQGSGLGENVILYFPYEPNAHDHSVSGDLSLSLKRSGDILGVRDFDSWNRGQDRNLCHVVYSVRGDLFKGTLDCPAEARDGGERLSVHGEFTCLNKARP